MEENQQLDLEMKLLRGVTVQFEHLQVKPLTLGEIETLGLVKYINLSHFATLTKQKVVGKKLMDTFKDFSFFNIIVGYTELRNTLLEFLRVFVLHDEDEPNCPEELRSIRYVPKVDTIVIRHNGTNGKLNSSNFEQFLSFMKKVNHVSETEKESDRDDVDDEMIELLKEFEEAEEKIAKDSNNEVTLTSIIEGVCTKHPSLNLLNIWEYTMYQFMRTYYRIEQIDNAKNIMTGIYSGCIESKKIDLKEYHWAKKLN